MTLADPHPATGQRRQRLTPSQAAMRLRELSNASDLDADQIIGEVVEIAASLIGALGVVFLSRDDEDPNRLIVTPEHYSPPHLAHLRSLLQHVVRLATVACAEETPQAGAAETGEEILVVAVPVFSGKPGNEAIAAAISVESQAQARSTAAFLTQLLTWISAYLAPLRIQSGQAGSAADNANLQRISSVLHEASQHKDFSASSRTIAEWIRDETDSPIVVVGVRTGWQRQCQVLGYSGSHTFDKRSKNIRILSEVLEETLIADSNPDIDDSMLRTNAVSTLKHQADLEIENRYPLRNTAGDTFGAILCLRDANADPPVTNQGCLPAGTVRILGQHLALLQATEPNTIVRKLGIHRAGTRWYRHPFTWTTCFAVILLMLMPMPLRVKCSCQVQPKQRRFVSVPYEGRLEQALTEPGEIVTKGQLLARMDGREIQWEISGLTAERQRVEKDRDTALAGFDTAAAQKAGLESKRIQLELDVLQERLHNLEIRSPVDGIVMGGDPRKLEGARLSMGETLLEVGPMDQMIVELEIPDEDVAHVEEQQTARYRLNALPWKAFEGSITTLHPRSESRNNENVFVAEVIFDNKDQLLRPGMHGRAKIKAAYHPLGWNLFHKAWDGLVTWIAW